MFLEFVFLGKGGGKIMISLETVSCKVKVHFLMSNLISMRNRYNTDFLYISTALMTFFLLSQPTYAYKSPDKINYCDPYLYARNYHPYGYIERKNRCEGLYVKEIANTTLLVASLTKSFEDYDLTMHKDLNVQWHSFGDGAIRLRAIGLKRKLYYRMDTMLPVDSSIFRWSPKILAALNIPKNLVGVVGWNEYSFKGDKKRVYLPLRINQQSRSDKPSSYRLILLPGQELKEVYISLAKVDKYGHPEVFLIESQALGYGYYPAERGITIPITNLENPGVYYLELGATLKNGGSSTVDLLFFHKPN